MKNKLRRMVVSIIAAYAIVAAIMFFMQRQILFQPDKEMAIFSDYTIRQHNFEEIIIRSSDGLKLQAWYRPPGRPYLPFIVYLHGNAGNISNRLNKYITFADKSNYGVLALSYRGYGKSQGKPTEQGLYKDARAAINYILGQDAALHDIILYGESLGTAVATEIASDFDLKALVLEAPFTSTADVAKETYWYLPVKYMVRDKFDTISKIKSVNMPVLIMHGKKDRVVPIEHGKRLYQAASYPKKMVVFEENGHTDFDVNNLIKELVDFVEKAPSY